MNNTIATFECTVVQKELLLVGQSITANFPDSFPQAAITIQKQFVARKHELSNTVHQEILYSPYMCNGIFATYFACLEVEDLMSIPEGMIGFKLPYNHYAKISCSTKTIGEGYDKIFTWMNEQGLRQKYYDQSCQIEIYYFEEQTEEERVELLIPIQVND